MFLSAARISASNVKYLGAIVLKPLLNLENGLLALSSLYRTIKRNTAAVLGCIVVFGLSVLGYKIVYLACRKESGLLCRSLCALSAPLVLPICALVTWTLAITLIEVVSLPAYQALSELPHVLASSWLDYSWFTWLTDFFHTLVSLPIKNQPYMASAEFMVLAILFSFFPLGSAALSWRRVPCAQVVEAEH